MSWKTFMRASHSALRPGISCMTMTSYELITAASMSHLRVSCSPSSEPLYPTLFSSSSSSLGALPVGLDRRSLSALNEQMRSWCVCTTSGSSVGAASGFALGSGGGGGSSSAAALSAISALTRSTWSSVTPPGSGSVAFSTTFCSTFSMASFTTFRTAASASSSSAPPCASRSSCGPCGCSKDTRRCCSLGGGGDSPTGSTDSLERSFFRSMISEIMPSRATGPFVARCAVGRPSLAVSSRRSSSRSPSSSRASFVSATYRRLQLAHSATFGDGMATAPSRWAR